jgi:hypothetical protein
MFVTQNLKSWEYGLLKAGKVLMWIVAAAIVGTLINWISSYTPTSSVEVMEFGLINVVLVGVQNWIQAHQAIKAASTPTSVPVQSTPQTDQAQG